MNIDKFEKNLNLFSTEPAKAMSMVLNLCIKHQAMLEGILNTQNLIMAQLRNDSSIESIKEMHDLMEREVNDRISVLQAEVASRI